MPLTFHDHGLTLAYPDNWRAEASDSVEGWSLLLQSPGTAFVQVWGQPAAPDEKLAETCKALLASALAALKEDYPELEAEEAAPEKIAGRIAQGVDVRFISLDLTASCCLRTVALPTQALLFLCQTSDLELDLAEAVFRAVRVSVRLTV